MLESCICKRLEWFVEWLRVKREREKCWDVGVGGAVRVKSEGGRTGRKSGNDRQKSGIVRRRMLGPGIEVKAEDGGEVMCGIDKKVVDCQCESFTCQ